MHSSNSHAAADASRTFKTMINFIIVFKIIILYCTLGTHVVYTTDTTNVC